MNPKLILFLLACLAGLFFLGGIIAAGILSIKGKPKNMPAFLSRTVTTIGGILATNLGAVLGINVVRSNSPAFRIVQVPTTEVLQNAAAILYLVGLLAALLFWAFKAFKEDPDVVVPTLPELSLTLLGVIGGALAVIIGLSNT
jgi:predicted transporter